MSENNRATLTFVLWLFSAASLGCLFISAAAQGELSSGHMLLAFVILALAVAGTPYIQRQTEGETQQAKAKRQRIDSLLRDMSDEELIELKQRLTDGDYSVENIVNALGDDGELVQRR